MDNLNGNKEISSKEFQRKLFDWFEKRGLLSELRAFMRHRMIAALYSSESPCPPSHFSSGTPVSPSLQAMLLLVAEFLVQQEYHYTMSVMVAEAPLLASFPKFSGYVSYMSQTDNIQKGSNFPRYSERDVQEILEVLGMSSNSESMEHVLRLYLNNNARESLLACVLTALSAIVQNCSNDTYKQNKTAKPRKNINDADNSTQWIEEIRLILLRAQLTSGQLQQVEDLIRKLHVDTANRTRKEERERNNKLNHIREQELLAAALVREEKFRAQTHEADEDLRNKQKHLEQVSLQLRQQHDEVLNRLTRVQKHADEVKKQENDLIEREKALEKKQAMIEEEHHTLSALRAELQEAAHSLRQEHSDTKTIVELSRLQDRCLHLETELKETKNQLFTSSVNLIERGIQTIEVPERDLSSPQKEVGTSATHHKEHHSSSSSLCSSIEKPQEKREKNSQVTLLKRVLQRIQQENTELRAIAAQQRRRIDELTTRATQLANFVAEQSDIPSLLREEKPDAVPQQSPQPPPLPPRYTNGRVRNMSGGDIPQSAPQPSIPTSYSPRAHAKDWRKKPSKRSMQFIPQSTSLSSDESPTEEVLREARNRLKRLEEESEAVDRRYRDFRARQVDCLSTSTTVGFAPKEQSSVNINMGQSLANTQNQSTGHLGSTFPMHQAQFSSPTRFGIPRASLATAVRAPSSTLSGLTPNLSVLQRTQTLLPDRSVYSLPQTGNATYLSGTLSSVPYQSSAIRRPTDRFRNLISNQSSFGRGASLFADTSHSFATETGPNVQPTHSTLEKKANLDNVQPAYEAHKINTKPLSDKMVSQGICDLPEQVDTTEKYGSVDDEAKISTNAQNMLESSVQKPSLLPEFDGRLDNQLVTTNAGYVVEPGTSSLNVEQPSLNPVTPSKARAASPPNHNSILVPMNAPLAPLLPSVPLPETVQTTVRVEPTPLLEPPLPSQSEIEEILERHSTSSAQTPPPLPHAEKDKLPDHNSTSVEQPIPPPVQPDENLRSPVQQKPNFVDTTTLNDVSTLSSSPAVSSTHASSKKPIDIFDLTAPHKESDKDVLAPSILPSVFTGDKDVKQMHDNSNSMVPSLLQRIQNDSTIPGRTSQLLNTSLSSIENSERRVSAGSEEKGTDVDDDDFW